MKKQSYFDLLEKNKIFIKFHEIIIEVKQKSKLTELGTTGYTFSYSFKGDMLNNPINPAALTKIARDMAKFIDNKGQTLIALDRGGTALGLAVSMIKKMPVYIAFSYFTSPPKKWVHWREKGAGKSLAIPPLAKNTHVILIDDEINTGLTYIEAIKALKKISIFVDQIVVVAEIARKKVGREIINNKFKDIKINSLYSIPEPQFHTELKDYVFDI